MNKEQFIKEFDYAIYNHYLYVGVIIYTEGNSSNELIINHRLSFKNKYDYYLNAYDDNMELKATKGKKVIKVTDIIYFYNFEDLDRFLSLDNNEFYK